MTEDDVVEQVISLRESALRQTELLEKVAKTIYGNGQKGVTTTLAEQAQFMKLMGWVMTVMFGTTMTLGIKAVFEVIIH